MIFIQNLGFTNYAKMLKWAFIRFKIVQSLVKSALQTFWQLTKELKTNKCSCNTSDTCFIRDDNSKIISKFKNNSFLQINIIWFDPTNELRIKNWLPIHFRSGPVIKYNFRFIRQGYIHHTRSKFSNFTRAPEVITVGPEVDFTAS